MLALYIIFTIILLSVILHWPCKIGIHNWYHGRFVSPVYGRSERHCLTCDKKQYAIYIKNKMLWRTFK